MMRMKQRITSLFLLAGLVTMLAGCGETFNVKKGDQVRFTVFTNSEPGTKTEYGGYDDRFTFERIRWSVGDKIRIFSTNTEIVRAKWADNRDAADYYDYKISSRKDSLDRYCKGTLTWAEEGGGEGYGLVWVNDPYNVSLYGVYPSATPQYKSETDKTIVAFTGMTIPESQSATLDMSHAYMVSAPSEFQESGYVDEHGQSIPSMEMEFYPFFNAFYIELKSDSDNGIKINSVTLSSTSDYLSGDYKYLFLTNNGIPAVNNVTYNYSDVTNSVTADLTSLSDTDRTATSSHAVGVTLLTLPPTSSNGLTNMTLTVNYNDNESKSLKLNDHVTVSNGVQTDEGTPIKFKPFYKTRITGLVMKGNKWQLTIDGNVLPWIYDEQKTTFSQNVQAKAFYVDGALETLPGYTDSQATIDLYGKKTSNNYESYDTGTNDDFKTYPEWVALGSGQTAYNTAHKSYYQLYYQLRTLNMNVQPPKKPYFEVTFTPMAPLGGYWTLSTASAPSFGNTSQGGAEGFRIVLWDGETESTNWSSGQIMNQEVTLRIYPSDSRDPSKEYCMLLKSSFSPNKNGEPSYSADSELQDVHGDGRYSYWKFVIPATE